MNTEQQQRDKSKQYIQQTFNLVASGYDSPALRYFPFTADYMTTLVKPKAGERVLDIATGTGVAAIALAQQILPGGRVQAIDFSDKMLAMAKFNINKHALTNIDLQQMDAENLEFRSNYFDIISASFVLFFLSDANNALKQWHRVLKPGGRLIFTTFSISAFMPMLDLFRHSLAQYDVNISSDKWQTFSDSASCQAVLNNDQFTDIHTQEKQHGFYLATEHDWWEVIYNSGLRGFVEILDAQQQDKFRAQHLQEIAALKQADGIWMDVNVLYTQATKI